MNSAPKPEKEAKAGRRSRLARGVRVFANPQRGKWMVQVLVEGKRTTTSWPTQEAAMEHARTCSAAKKEHGTVALSAFSGEEVRAWMQVRDALQGAPLKALLECWEKHGKAFRGGMAVSEAIDSYLALTHSEQTHGTDTRRHVTKSLARFADAFGSRPLPSITTDELRAWVPLACKEHELGADARNALVKQVRALFNRGQVEGWCEANPAKAVATTRVTRDEVSVLSIEAAKKLFSTLRNEPISLRLALEAFGGIRHSGTTRLSRDDFKRKERGLLLPARKAKGAVGKQRRHYADFLPANLWAWVDRWWNDDRAWSMTASQVMHAKSKGFRMAGVPHPKNVLRHSFASYHVALHQDAAKTALLMQHTSQLVLWGHYKGVASKADAAKFFKIVP